MKVYLINVDDFQSCIDPLDLSYEDFMTEAERQGTVYSLEGFVNSFNNGDNINSSTDVIRII